MKIHIPYGESGLSFDLSDKNIWQIIFPYMQKAIDDFTESLYRAMEEPIASLRLSQIISAKGEPDTIKVAIICDDFIEGAPYKKILDVLIPYLKQHGVLLSNVKIIVANTSNLGLSTDELFEIFGSWISPITVESHNPNNEGNLTNVGQSFLGKEISLNKSAVEADLKISISSIVPNTIKGFTGGSKTVLPGIAGISAIYKFFTSYAFDASCGVGKISNSMQKLSDQAAEMLGLDFIINVVQNAAGGICGIFCGHYKEAYQMGTDFATNVLGVRVRPGADMVIAGSYPADFSIWQAFEVYASVSPIVKDGGLVVIVTPCFESSSGMHSNIKRYLSSSDENLFKMLIKGESEDSTAIAFALRLARELKRVGICILSDNIKPEDARMMKINLISNIEEALKFSETKLGTDMKISIVPYGGKIFPYFEEETGQQNHYRTEWM